jgi:hypothetical protein
VNEVGDVVNWTLTKDPNYRVSYQAVARCPHGTSQHLLAGTPQALMNGASLLHLPHTRRSRCACLMGAITIDGVPFDPKGGSET